METLINKNLSPFEIKKVESDLLEYEKYVENFWWSHRFNTPVIRMKTFKEMFGYEVIISQGIIGNINR